MDRSRAAAAPTPDREVHCAWIAAGLDWIALAFVVFGITVTMAVRSGAWRPATRRAGGGS